MMLDWMNEKAHGQDLQAVDHDFKETLKSISNMGRAPNNPLMGQAMLSTAAKEILAQISQDCSFAPTTITNPFIRAMTARDPELAAFAQFLEGVHAAGRNDGIRDHRGDRSRHKKECEDSAVASEQSKECQPDSGTLSAENEKSKAPCRICSEEFCMCQYLPLSRRPICLNRELVM